MSTEQTTTYLTRTPTSSSLIFIHLTPTAATSALLSKNKPAGVVPTGYVLSIQLMFMLR